MFKWHVDRRHFLKQVGMGAAASLLPVGAAPARANWGSHGLSVFGALKYPADFSNFDYVNPKAPKGGKISLTAPDWSFNQSPQTFNSFNSFILKGDAPPRMELCFDSLMVRAFDEPDAVYGLVAETALIAEDGNTATFNLRSEAKFHDGSELTSEDVVFSLETLKEKGHPLIRTLLAELSKAEAPDKKTVVLTFSGNQSRHLPLQIATLPILSKRYYTRYDFSQSTLTPPLSSGPYSIGRHEIGRYVEYKAVEDWWAKDLPVVRGHNNFNTIRIDFFRDRQTAFEAFKKGNITYREDFSSKTWATEYSFPAVVDGKVVKREYEDRRPAGAQGWFFNTRLKKFSDPRVRQAIGMAFDFQWSNEALFFGLYSRTQSFFENSPMKAIGLPEGEELQLLEKFRGKVPDTVFGEAILPPVSNGSGQDRNLLAQASELFVKAGYTRSGNTLLDRSGDPVTFEFLSSSQVFERIVLPYIKNLRLLGVEATFRVVDPAQYQLRLNTFDYDIVSMRYATEPTLSEAIRQFWGSKQAGIEGSYNLAGITDPVVDQLIDIALSAQSREKMMIAARALDRVLRSGYYWVPQWYKPVHTVALWDMFGTPKTFPEYSFPVETTWWVDLEKAVRIGKVD
ncbi:ABC transporter substrate-binding protein [Flexibacterium corallicola]|uniref:ABC transporter substrate-binding protein n=1 Tax=Flexibacterium corallicola TaxID=3037259 RepID=UPI00286F854F|nr:ABC transporter substrate-binding protein [Pseudovibrio sp. M1P-2-3]